MKIFREMTQRRLREITDAFSRVRIAVLGDYFLDKYLDVDPALAERSVETGKVAHQVVDVRHSPGAAGTVACNLAALGAGSLHAVGLTGDDGEAFELRRGLTQLGCNVEHLHVDSQRHTPTYLKPRDAGDASLAGEHPRYDTKNRETTPAEVERQIIASLDALLPGVDAVIIADQVEEADCGVVTARVREALAQRALAHGEVVFWADSRRRIREFRHVIVKPNQFEAVGRDDPRPEETVALNELEPALLRLRHRLSAPVCVTRGPEGMLVSDPQPTLVPGVRVAGPTDPTGAGDSATAGAVLALATGAELAEAALLGNLVASITVEQLATTGTARVDQLAQRLTRWQDGV